LLKQNLIKIKLYNILIFYINILIIRYIKVNFADFD